MYTLTAETKPASFREVGFTLVYTYSWDKTSFISRTGIHTRVRTLTAVTKPASFREVGFTLEYIHLQLWLNPLHFENWDSHLSTYTYSCDKPRFILRSGIHTRVRTLTVVTKPASFWEVGFTLEYIHLQLWLNPLNFEKWDLHSSTYTCSCDKTQFILRTRFHTTAHLQFWLNPLRIHIGVHIIIAVTKPADFGELEFTLEYTYSCARYASFGELGFTLE